MPRNRFFLLAHSAADRFIRSPIFHKRLWPSEEAAKHKTHNTTHGQHWPNASQKLARPSRHSNNIARQLLIRAVISRSDVFVRPKNKCE